MNGADFLGEIISVLNRAEIRYMIAGSFASSFHAEPRTTNDLDVVIDVEIDDIERLLAIVDRDVYYIDDDDARDAARLPSMFNIIDYRAGWKADLIVRRDRRFSREEFDRRQRVRLYGHDTFVATAEDTILSKLEWPTKGGSQRQLADAAAVLRSQAAVDDAYLDRWAPELGVEAVLAQARSLAHP